MTLAVCTLFVAGCGGGGGVQCTGTLMDGGSPAVYSGDYEYGGYKVEFFPLDESGNLAAASSYTAEVDASGKFTVVDPLPDKGIPAGKYRVGVYLVDQVQDGDEMVETDDALGGKFGRETSPFTVDVSGAPITVDLAGAQPTGAPAPSDDDDDDDESPEEPAADEG